VSVALYLLAEEDPTSRSEQRGDRPDQTPALDSCTSRSWWTACCGNSRWTPTSAAAGFLTGDHPL